MNPNTFNKITRLLNGESFITKEPGNSMLPLYKSNEEHLLTPITWEQCKVGDVVFCKVKGSCLTHKVYAIDSKKGCLIGNNKGHMNGWTKNVYGLAHKQKMNGTPKFNVLYILLMQLLMQRRIF